MSYFKGLGAAKISEQGVWLEPGTYRLTLNKLATFNSRDKKQFTVADFTIKESSNPKFPVGSTCNWMQNMAADAAFPAIKGLALAVLGYRSDDPDTKTEAFQKELEDGLDAAVEGLDNEYVGQDVNVTVVLVKTKKGTDFSRHNWTPAA